MWGVSEAPVYKFPYQTSPEIQIIDIATYNSPEEVLGGEIEPYYLMLLQFNVLEVIVKYCYHQSL